MSVELHIARTVFATIVGRAVQLQCRTACFSALGPVHVDHLDARPDAIEFRAADTGGVGIRVPIDVFIVTDDALYAAPNGEPATSKIPAVLVLLMGVEGAKVSLRVVDLEPDPSPSAGTDALKEAIIDALNDPLELDLAASLGVVGMLALFGGSSVELTSETVAVRFAPSGQVQARLHPGQDWGIYLDETSLKAFVGQRIPNLPEVVPQITSFDPVTHWRPEGDQPRIDVEFQGKADVPVVSGDFDGAFRIRLSIANTGQRQLRADIDWELHPHLGALVPEFLEDVAEKFAVAMVDPTKFGATRTGVRSFRQDTALPTIEFGPTVAGIVTRFEWHSALASADGMTIGGPVRPLADPGNATLQTTVTQFGRPRGTVLASQHDCRLEGIVPDELMILGSVGLNWCGAVCGFDVLPPNTGLEQHVEVDPFVPESQSLRIRLPLAVGKEVTSPFHVLVYTSRGVRLLDLGVPQADEEADIGYIDDCDYMDTRLIMQKAYDEWMALYGDLDIDGLVPPPLPPDRPNPLDDPDPLTDSSGIYARTIVVDNLEAGELLQLRTPDCAIVVTTDQDGRASIPVILAGTDRAQMSLTRVNRGDISSAVTRTAVFARQAAVPRGTLGNTLSVDAAGNALVSTDFDDGSDLYEVAPTTGSRQVASRSARPDAPVNQDAATDMDIDLPGLLEIVRVPGFADAPVAIAVMDDGEQLVLNQSADGTTRVAGTFTGNLPRIEVRDDWAMASARGRLTVFRRSSSQA